MSEEKGANQKRDLILDIDGYAAGLTMNRTTYIYLIAAAACMIIFPLIGPAIGLPSAKAGFVLGLTLATVILWISNLFNISYPLLFFIAVGFVFKLFEFKDLQSALGSSQFLMMFGMFMVAQGAEQTPIAKRVAYFFLWKFGKNQALMLLAIYLASAVLSVFCSNLASTVVMAAICIGIVRELEKVDPNSRSTFGKATMLLIPLGAMTGGLALISSSPGMNALGVTTLAAASEGAADLSYTRWATVGIPSAILCAFPTWFIYQKFFKVPTSGAAVDPEVFHEEYKKLGKIGGSELRWVIIVLSMVGAMIAGVPSGVASLTAAAAAISPYIGCMEGRKAIKRISMDMFFMMGVAAILATAFANYGIGSWLAGIFAPILKGLPPLALMFLCAIVMFVMNSLFANATFGIISILITVFTPIVMELGMNPVIILLPCIFLGACTNVVGVQQNMFLTYEYGYWDMKDPLIPGILTNLVWIVIITLLAYFIGPRAGMPLYL